MSDNKWTPEPWPDFHSKSFNGFVVLGRSDYDRARECVNALAGEENPELFVGMGKAHREDILRYKYPEYVHQLQNLYFALTGSELEFKL